MDKLEIGEEMKLFRVSDFIKSNKNNSKSEPNYIIIHNRDIVRNARNREESRYDNYWTYWVFEWWVVDEKTIALAVVKTEKLAKKHREIEAKN